MKPIVYIDMDNVLVDFASGIAKLDAATKEQYRDNYDEVPGIFSLMQPMPGAIEAVNQLAEKYDLYLLSTAPWLNPSAWSDKLLWVQKYFGLGEESLFYKRLIVSHHKNLNHGDFLIDDREKNGAKDFKGELILFGSAKYSNWAIVTDYLMSALGDPLNFK